MLRSVGVKKRNSITVEYVNERDSRQIKMFQKGIYIKGEDQIGDYM